MKKFLLIALVAIGFSIAGASRAEAHGCFSFGIGIGFPIGFGFGYPYGYPAYYPYCYGYGYPYGGYGPGFGVSYVHHPYYWRNGHRVYSRHRVHRVYRGY